MSRSNPKLLGIAASLRNARYGAGSRGLIDTLSGLPDAAALREFLIEESDRHLQNFLDAGRRDGKDFLEIYKNLGRLDGKRGLSNSEVALAAGLWAAQQGGADIDHLSLSEHFTATGDVRHAGALADRLRSVDGILLSGPVYFGDRGSLAESLIDFIARDESLRAALDGRLYGGIAVGAKRNGGQETTLIYQMLDMLDLGLVAVGNDSDTTAQYGGTGVAGDVGTMSHDDYGLDTAMGVGRRMARVLRCLDSDSTLTAPPKVLFLILREHEGVGERTVKRLIRTHEGALEATVLDLTQRQIRRCIACDICPTHIDVDDEYRCIIKARRDEMSDLHADLLGHDLIVPVLVSPKSRWEAQSNYQTFVERTRYLRRGDYVLSDQLVSPMVLEEVGANDTYLLRATTSFIRHHTVLSRPIHGAVQGGFVLNDDAVFGQFAEAVGRASRLAAGRLRAALDADVDPTIRYNPVGYVLSADKDREDERLSRRRVLVEERRARIEADAAARLSPKDASRAGG